MMTRALCLWWCFAAASCALLPARRAQAEVLQVPEGGATVTLPNDRVLCSPAPAGWIADGTRKRLRPRSDTPANSQASATMAPSFADCGTERESHATFIVTGPHPTIDPGSVSIWVDAGRAELRGKGLEGTEVGWQAGEISGSDRCLNVTVEGGVEVCALNVDKGMPADPLRIDLRWAPPGGRVSADSTTFDINGNPLSEERQHLAIGRVVIGRLFPISRTADIASGAGRVELVHPEAASLADCGAARCEVTDQGIVVSSVPAETTSINVRVRLQPRVFIARGDKLNTSDTESLSILRCPISVVSGDPLRNADKLKILVRMDGACGNDADTLRWTASGELAHVLQVERSKDGVYVLLRVVRTASDHIRIVALRRSDRSVVAIATARTWEVSALQTSLLLPGVGAIDFIPKNRDALLTVSAVEGEGYLVPVPVAGAYDVRRGEEGFFVRGVYTSGGYTALRFTYRVLSVPKAFLETDFAELSDPVQRPIRDANVPAPIGAASISKKPIAELLCAVKEGDVQSIPPGTAPHIPFAQRDSCRLVIHHSRVPAGSGEQRLNLEVSVTTVGGSERGEAKLSQRMIIRHARKRDVIWIRGAKQQFDRINIRITHVIDESQYLMGAKGTLELPSTQWSVITENANFRFYATAAIPASLFRFSNDPDDLGTGPLALNFGVLSRLTWLDSEGHEGLVGLELGVMGMGLATDRDRQLAVVSGLGIAIPLGNPNQPTQAAINIHAWAAYTIGERTAPLNDATGEFVRNVTLNPWAFVFGPSITIGSVGAFL